MAELVIRFKAVHQLAWTAHCFAEEEGSTVPVRKVTEFLRRQEGLPDDLPIRWFDVCRGSSVAESDPLADGAVLLWSTSGGLACCSAATRGGRKPRSSPAASKPTRSTGSASWSSEGSEPSVHSPLKGFSR